MPAVFRLWFVKWFLILKINWIHFSHSQPRPQNYPYHRDNAWIQHLLFILCFMQPLHPANMRVCCCHAVIRALSIKIKADQWRVEITTSSNCTAFSLWDSLGNRDTNSGLNQKIFLPSAARWIWLDADMKDPSESQQQQLNYYRAWNMAYYCDKIFRNHVG